VLLFFGAGLNVGLSVMSKFRTEGYKTVAVARTAKEEFKNAADMVIAADMSEEPSQVARIFEEVTHKIGTPTVVVYNGKRNSLHNGSDPLTVSPSDFAKDLAVNATSAYAAAAAFAALPSTSHPKVFIYTGNMQFSVIVDQTVSLGAGKNAMYYVIETAANIYGKAGKGQKGFWYVADERTEKGESVMGAISGPAHAEFFWELVNLKEQGPWNGTFVMGKGYKDF
ncbi:hypothetical protein K432DRAFT_268589, partial [Lepidopterella palustris CBS 459.81]